MVSEDFSSTLQRIAAKDLWKDNQNLTLRFSYSITPKFSLQPMFSSRILSDPLPGLDNDIQFYSGSAQLSYHPNSQVLISPRVSSKWQTQFDQSDHGFAYGWDAAISDFNFLGYNSDLVFLGEQDFFPRRRNEDVKLNYSIKRQFYESTADTLTVFFDRLRRDSFGADSSNIFVRNLTQSQKGFENRLSYRVAPDAIFYLINSISATTFTVNNLRDGRNDLRKDDSGFESEHSAKLSINRPKWFADSEWTFRSRSRQDNKPTPSPFDPFPSVGFDSDNVLTSLSLRGGHRIDANDSLGISASVIKFRYDTSDTVIANDHDQLKWQFTVGHTHRFSRQLWLTWHGSAFLNHFVFVSRKHSAGNNWERFIQLTPEVFYEPNQTFSFRQSVTVRAKYQIYDFDDPDSSIRNSVNRQFILSHQSNFAVSSSSRVDLSLNLELAEQGRFFINAWRQSLALSWRNQQIQARFRQRFGQTLTVSPGVNYFQQVRWQHKVNSEGRLEKSVRGKHTNIGPVLSVIYHPNSSMEVLFFGNIDLVSSSGRNTEQINNFNLNLNWFF